MRSPISTATRRSRQKGWATPQLLDTQKAQVSQLQNAVKSDQALIDAANVQLSYTRLTSPFDGVTGIRQIDVGNVIHPTDANGLVVVTQVEPISVIFTLPETSLPKIQQQQAKAQLAVFAYSQDGRSNSIKASSRLSTMRSCKPPVRYGSRQSFQIRPIGCGRAN